MRRPGRATRTPLPPSLCPVSIRVWRIPAFPLHFPQAGAAHPPSPHTLRASSFRSQRLDERWLSSWPDRPPCAQPPLSFSARTHNRQTCVANVRILGPKMRPTPQKQQQNPFFLTSHPACIPDPPTPCPSLPSLLTHFLLSVDPLPQFSLSQRTPHRLRLILTDATYTLERDTFVSLVSYHHPSIAAFAGIKGDGGSEPLTSATPPTPAR